MKLLLVRHLWGLDLRGGFSSYLERWRQVGYRGIECSPRSGSIGMELKQMLHEEDMAWVPQVFSSGQADGGTASEHLQSLRRQIEECMAAAPIFFNAQSGSDSWELGEAEEFYGAMQEVEAELGVTVCHETHRSRYFGNPWNTLRLLERLPAVKLTADFSHWVCVAERLLEDATPLLRKVAGHCHHIHARVGYEQGPQVPDPRAPEWQEHLSTHESWWEWIWSEQRIRGATVTSLTPEFGPPPYLHTLPHTQKPVADLNAICDWMASRQAEHFDRCFG